jgi:hypothetical protein
VCFLAFLVCGVPAEACINDNSTHRKEKEFKSQYENQEPAPAPQSTEPDLVAWGATGTAVAMFIGAVTLVAPCYRKTKSKTK